MRVRMQNAQEDCEAVVFEKLLMDVTSRGRWLLDIQLQGARLQSSYSQVKTMAVNKRCEKK
jgi:hypothetical protein